MKKVHKFIFLKGSSTNVAPLIELFIKNLYE